MSGETLYEAPRKHHVAKMRVHDYLYDSAFVVSGARDYARTSFKAAMASAQVSIQPVYRTMFSELRKFPRMQVVYYPNCRLPDHMDRSYGAYLDKVREARNVPVPDFTGKDRFKFSALPKTVLPIKTVSPEFLPATPIFVASGPTKHKNRATQSVFRESSAQTVPWQPDGVAAETCQNTPEVLYLDKLKWGPGIPYRIGDLPADFHTTEIINKMRHARHWNGLVEQGVFPRWMKKRDEIISDVETKDWIFREAEIDELQDIRLSLLHRIQTQERRKKTDRVGRKLSKLWDCKKQEMEKKIESIRKSRDRELRKLTAIHVGGGRPGQVRRLRAARGAGPVTAGAADPTSQTHAPLARNGYQARGRNADITYDPTLLSYEDHRIMSEPPEWLEKCGRDLTRTCSGHHLQRDPMQLCERETKWNESFLENLHNDLKKARLGAAKMTAGPLHVLKPRRVMVVPRPDTPEVEAVRDEEETIHQAALTMQRMIRGRAVHNLMYEGRTRAAELTEELKTTHGLQKEDKVRIAREETKAREYTAVRTEAEQKEDAIDALVDEVCGGAVSGALDFLEKELRRLKEERRQHAFILIALREKTMREAAEAGRRQKEEHRRREHDEMFKQIVGVTQETVDAYLREITTEGIEMCAEEDAVRQAKMEADRVDTSLKEHSSMSTAEQNEVVAELVQQFLLPEAHKTAARHRIAGLQQARMDAARATIFGLVDEAEIKERTCTQCGIPLGDDCRCSVCPVSQVPVETTSRDDPRWKHTRRRPRPPERKADERFPPYYDVRNMLNCLIDDVVVESRRRGAEYSGLRYDLEQMLRESVEIQIDARDILNTAIDYATNLTSPPAKISDYRHYMRRVIDEALARTEEKPHTCPKVLPSEIRRVADEEARRLDPTCRCEEGMQPRSRVQFGLDLMSETEKANLLPSEVRVLEEMRRCKCDTSPTPSPGIYDIIANSSTTYSTGFTVAGSEHGAEFTAPEENEEEP